MDGEQRPRQCSNGHHPPRTAPTNTALLTARVHLAYVLPNRSRRCPLAQVQLYVLNTASHLPLNLFPLTQFTRRADFETACCEDKKLSTCVPLLQQHNAVGE